ncbi:hypothetical protein ONS95_001581 [Cadophora gregata]|uniref:uncharacterized protein n=1 Tax=Cadophora gregata TaxID=51156 RepID=UPI0026DAD8EA|nr:uncharacterized protein ONS95_001581 [Cadophora gregata]KAK0111206.1 hypothetical protein ONS95_001581 [Cadophora gregata]
MLQVPPGVPRRYAALAGIVLAALWIWVAFDRPYHFPTHTSWNIYTDRPVTNFYSSAIAISDVFDFDPIESESIKSICEEAQWNQSIVFRCDASVGGIGNIRNSILNCVRYAISAGAGLVIPTIVMRDSADISLIRTGVNTEMRFMFEPQHFVDSLRLSCPSLRVFSTVAEVQNYDLAPPALSIIPEDLVKDPIPATGLRAPEKWRALLYEWLEQYPKTDPDAPYIVSLGRSYLKYPIYSDGEGFALAFGGILKLRNDVRVLATKTLQALAERYNFQGDLSEAILHNLFFGAHLRTEKDAAEGWPVNDWEYSRYETQAKHYLEQAPRSSPAVIYVASGDLAEVGKFATDAAAINLTVTTKFDLLTGPDLHELNALAWDQQALVDFLVMQKASDFAGIGHSSFAWNIALKRHTLAASKNHLDGPQMLSDELSQIYGRIRGYPEYAACLWP